MLRFKLEDLPPRQREQAARQLSPNPSRTLRTADLPTGTKASPSASRPKKVRPPITMVAAEEQTSAERRFNADFLGGRGKFEALTLHLPGGSRYTPDFYVTSLPLFPSEIVLCEVKGSYRLQSHSRAATAFKTACAVYPEFVFCWAEQQKAAGCWKVAFYRGGKILGECREGTAKDILAATSPSPNTPPLALTPP